jgi:hypothetical protein
MAERRPHVLLNALDESCHHSYIWINSLSGEINEAP